MTLDDHELTLCVVGWNPLAMTLQSSWGHHKCRHQTNMISYMYPDNWVSESLLFAITCLICLLIYLFIICLLIYILRKKKFL